MNVLLNFRLNSHTLSLKLIMQEVVSAVSEWNRETWIPFNDRNPAILITDELGVIQYSGDKHDIRVLLDSHSAHVPEGVLVVPLSKLKTGVINALRHLEHVHSH